MIDQVKRVLGKVRMKPPVTRSPEAVEDELATLRADDAATHREKSTVLAEFRSIETAIKRR